MSRTAAVYSHRLQVERLRAENEELKQKVATLEAGAAATK